MSTDLNERGTVTFIVAAISCQRCGRGWPGYQITGPNGYVQLCGPCLVDLVRVVVKHHANPPK